MNFGVHRHCHSGDIMILAYQVMLQKTGPKGSSTLLIDVPQSLL